MRSESWKQRVERWRGGGPVEEDLSTYREILNEINLQGEKLVGESDDALRSMAIDLRERATRGGQRF